LSEPGENLIQAVNIVGALFYPVMLSLFVVGFFLRRITGTAVFLGRTHRASGGAHFVFDRPGQSPQLSLV